LFDNDDFAGETLLDQRLQPMAVPSVMHTNVPVLLWRGFVVLLWLLLLQTCGGEGSSDKPPPADGFTKIMVDDSGGDFELGNGLKLSIPANAVSGEIQLQFRRVEANEIEIPPQILRQFDTRIIAGFEARPAGFTFAQPVTLIFTGVGTVAPTSLLYPLMLDTSVARASVVQATESEAPGRTALFELTQTAAGEFQVDFSQIRYNPQTDSLYIPNLDTLPAELQKVVVVEVRQFLENSDCVENPCRCGEFEVESEDFDSSTGGSNEDDKGCYSTYSNGFVKYLDCEHQPFEPWSLQEANADVIIQPTDFTTLKLDQSTTFTFTLSDENGDLIPTFTIDSVIPDDLSVATVTSISGNTVSVQAVGFGITSADVTISALGCEYHDDFTVEVEAGKIIAYSPVKVAEGEVTSIGVKLSEPPAEGEDVVVTATESGDDDILILFGNSLTFSHANWNSEQFILVDAAEDDKDAVNGQAVITLEPSLEQFKQAEITVSEIDNDTVNFVPEGVALSVPEGGSAGFPVKLNVAPEEPVTTSVSLLGDQNIGVTSGNLTFDGSNWDKYQHIRFFATPDPDCKSGTATVTVSDSSGQTSSLLFAVSEIDLDDDCNIDDGDDGDDGDDSDDSEQNVFHNYLYLSEAKANWNGTWARWQGVVPITATHTANNPIGSVSGTGTLSYDNSYSWLSAPHSGYDYPYDTVSCHFREQGTIDVQISGTRSHFDSTKPRWLVTATVTDTDVWNHHYCTDGFRGFGENTHPANDRQVSLGSDNGYLDLFFGQHVRYQGELLDKGNP
jgi:hypothetical protein